MLVIENDVPGPFAAWSTDTKDELQRILSERAAKMGRDLSTPANLWSLWEWVGPWDGRRDPGSVRDTTRNLYFVNSANSRDELIAKLMRRQSWVFQRREKVALLNVTNEAESVLHAVHTAGSEF